MTNDLAYHLCSGRLAATRPVAIVPPNVLKSAPFSDQHHCVLRWKRRGSTRWILLEAMMPGSKKEETNGRAFAMSVLWILVLLAGYWLIADWQVLPRLISSTFGA